MGGILSHPSLNPKDSQNSESSPKPQNLSSSPSISTLPQSAATEPKTLENQTPTDSAASPPSIGREIPDEKNPDSSKQQSTLSKNAEDDDKEEEGECGFCLFMKEGGCKDSFIAWELCVEESEKQEEDFAEKCSKVTKSLMNCMEQHSDYYAPILGAEKRAKEMALKELERETANASTDSKEQETANASTDSKEKETANASTDSKEKETANPSTDSKEKETANASTDSQERETANASTHS